MKKSKRFKAIALTAFVIGLMMTLTHCTKKPSTPGAEAEPTKPTATPAAALTREEKLAQEIVQSDDQLVDSLSDCKESREDGPKCGVVKSAVRVTRPEWEELFPQTEFFLAKIDLYGYESRQRGNILIAEQDDLSLHFPDRDFDRLLNTNGITISDENRELIARAFALMTIPNYLEEEVVFTEWGKVDMQPARHDYNYCLRAWTKIQGLEIRWCFVFRDERLKIASGPAVQQHGVGDYIDVLHLELPLPAFKDYRFTGE